MLIVLVVGYMVFMLPANLGMRIIGPPRQLGIAVIFFGACGTCLSASKNYGTIMGLRVLIGMGEAFVQVGLLYFSFWYVIFSESSDCPSHMFCEAFPLFRLFQEGQRASNTVPTPTFLVNWALLTSRLSGTKEMRLLRELVCEYHETSFEASNFPSSRILYFCNNIGLFQWPDCVRS